MNRRVDWGAARAGASQTGVRDLDHHEPRVGMQPWPAERDGSRSQAKRAQRR